MSAGSRSAGSGIRYSVFCMSDKMRQRRDRRILEHQLRSQLGAEPFLELDDEIGRGRGIETELGKICLGPDRDRGIVDGLLQIGDAPVANIGFGDTGRRQTTLLVIRHALGGGATRQLAAVETTACDAKPALPLILRCRRAGRYSRAPM